ncbi:hypothetical protein OEZ86_004364 [Tetradesmus obliquus]|nr:hypothetical protein OEZ86_004364 [Tetradesmus obliquus]
MGRNDPPELDEQPMLGSVFFNRNRRPQDVAWKWLYIASVLLTIVGGISALTHRNKDFSRLISSDYLADPGHCPVGPSPTRRLLGSEDDFQPKLFLEAAGLCTGVSIAGGLLLGLLALYLIKSKPHAMVGAAVGLQVLLPAAAGVTILAAGGGGGSVPMFLMSGLLAFVFYLYRQQLALVGRLLGVASHALVDNPSIVGGSLLLQAGGLLLIVPMLAGVLLAYTNGGVIPNPAAASVDAGAKTCTDDQGQAVACCAWMPEGWAIAYMAWGSLVVGWSSLLVFTVKVFVISGVTAQWYFAPATQKPRGALRRSLGHALGPNFGSLCLAAWLLNLLQMLKSMAENARAENRDNFFVQLLVSCFEFLLTLLEAVTKFAVVRLAITGDALMPSCRSTADLLARNLLDSVGVWWFPGMILQVTALLLSCVWGLAVFGLSYGAWGGDNAALSSGIAMGVLAFFFGVLTVSFINSILLNIVDAVYICFAMDRDAQACTRLEVHEVYALLPSNKAPLGVVEQPDGNYAFGSTPAATAGHGGQPGLGHGQQVLAYAVPHAGGYAQPAVGYPSVPRA